MERTEAEAKLKYYHTDYGDLVYTASSEALREHAADFRKQANEETNPEAEVRLKLLIKAVQYETVATCREILGTQDAVVEEKANVCSMAMFLTRRNALEQIAQAKEEGINTSAVMFSADDDDGEPDFFTMMELTQKAVKPRFKIGDPCWVTDCDETGQQIGYLAATVVGLELYPDEIFYMIGFHDDEDDLVTTHYDSVKDEEIFEEMPKSETVEKKRPVLTIVK